MALKSSSSSKPKDKDKEKPKPSATDDEDKPTPSPAKVQLSFTNWMMGGSLITNGKTQTSLRQRRRDAQGNRKEIVIAGSGGNDDDDEYEEEIMLVKKRTKRKSTLLKEEKKVEELEKPKEEAKQIEEGPMHLCGKETPTIVEEIKAVEPEKQEQHTCGKELDTKGSAKVDAEMCEVCKCPKPKDPDVAAAEKKVEDDKKAAEELKLTDEKKAADEKRAADEAKAAEAKKAEEGEKAADDKKAADEKKAAGDKKVSEKVEAPWVAASKENKDDKPTESGWDAPGWDSVPAAEKDTGGDWDEFAKNTDSAKDTSKSKVGAKKGDSSPKKDDKSKKGDERWTAEKDAKIQEMFAEKKSFADIGTDIGESENDVKGRWFKVLSKNLPKKGGGKKDKKGQKSTEKAPQKSPEKTKAIWEDCGGTGWNSAWGNENSGGDTGGEPSWGDNNGDGAPNTTEEATGEWGGGGDNIETAQATTGNEGWGDGNTGGDWGDAGAANSTEKKTDTDANDPWMSGGNGDGKNKADEALTVSKEMEEAFGNMFGEDVVEEVKDGGMSWAAAQKVSGKWGGSNNQGDKSSGKKTYFTTSKVMTNEKKKGDKSAENNNKSSEPSHDVFKSYWASQNTSNPEAAPTFKPQAQSQPEGSGKLVRTEIWTEEDCTVLEELMKRYKEHKWLNMQAQFFNWTGRMISAEMIEKKFKDDGA